MEWTNENTAPIGKIPSGLFIITAADGENIDGYLGSWVQQVSFNPLMIAVAIKPGRPCYDIINDKKRFCINVVGKKNNGLMKPFWKGYDPEAKPFANLQYDISNLGNVILQDSMAAIECLVEKTLTPGDHEVLFAKVENCHFINPEDQPLTHIRKSGLIY